MNKKLAESLYNETRKLHKRWGKCRRWYKWLSVLPLFLSGTLAASSVCLVVTGTVLVAGGSCVGEAGERMETEVDIYVNDHYQRTETRNHGAPLIAIAIFCICYGIGLLVAGCLCYILSWVFLFISGVYFYENVNFAAPTEFWELNETVEKIDVYSVMNRYTPKTFTVNKTHIIVGKAVYTGWIKTSFGWIPSQSTTGQIVLKRASITFDSPIPQGRAIFGTNMITFDYEDDENIPSLSQEKIFPDLESEAQNISDERTSQNMITQSAQGNTLQDTFRSSESFPLKVPHPHSLRYSVPAIYSEITTNDTRVFTSERSFIPSKQGSVPTRNSEEFNINYVEPVCDDHSLDLSTQKPLSIDDSRQYDANQEPVVISSYPSTTPQNPIAEHDPVMAGWYEADFRNALTED